MLIGEMTLKEVYDSVILDNYNIALQSIKVVDTDVFKTGLVVNCIRSMNIILFNALKDETYFNVFTSLRGNIHE